MQVQNWKGVAQDGKGTAKYGKDHTETATTHYHLQYTNSKMAKVPPRRIVGAKPRRVLN